MNPELARLMALANAGRHAEVEAWARPRAEAGDADGQFLLGFLVYAGARIDFATAKEWLHRAAAQDHAEALYQLARIDDSETRTHSRKPINDTMRARMRRAAELGSADAQHDLGVLLSMGEGGFPKDQVESRQWQERAARAGHLLAQVSFGRMCLRGEGGRLDTVEGLAWLERAAATDISSNPWGGFVVRQAASLLALVYTRGIPGVPPDPTKAAAAKARLEAASAARTRERAADDCAGGFDAYGRWVTRPFAFANPDEARRVLADHLAAQRRRGRNEWIAGLDREVKSRLRGPSGLEYEVSLTAFWSDQPDGEITVSASIQDFGWQTFTTISESFRVAVDGTVLD